MSQRLSAGAVATIVVVTAVVLAPVASIAPAAAQSTPPTTGQFAVAQGTTCTVVSPVTNTSQSVVDFYDYRNPHAGYDDSKYASYGTLEYQETHTSVMLFYTGSNATSLVTINDRLGDEAGGSTVTMEFSGLPADGKWAVRDDLYPEQDDDWELGETTTTVDWKWADNRTDGGTYTGFGEFNGTTVVDPGFNEDAAHWNTWGHAGSDAYRMDAWVVKGADGSTRATLDMDRRLFVNRGGCLTTSPSANLSSPDRTEPGTNVTFTADATTDAEAEIGGYEWDFDNDGEIDQVTTDASVSRAFSDSGDHTVSVTAFDTYGNGASDETTVNVVQAPTASLDAPAEATVNQSIALDASGSTDDGTVTEFRWDFDADGTVDQNTTSGTVEHTYNQTGDVTAEVTVVDDDNATATASATITVRGPNSPPTATLDVPSTADEGEEVMLNATGSDDDRGIASYEWDFEGDDTPDATTDSATVTHTYTAGNYTPTVTVVDSDEAEATANATITVQAASSPPTASLDAPAEATVNQSIVLDASGSSDEGSVTEFRWDFDADGTVDQNTTSGTVEHTYNQTGDVTAEVTVVDNDGATATASTTLTVSESEPELDAALSVGTENPTANESVSFDASASSPTDSIVSYEWTFGDDETASGQTVEHTYNSSGTYTVTLEIQSSAGDAATTNTTVEVAPDDSSSGGDDGNDGENGNDGGNGNDDGGNGNNNGENNAGRNNGGNNNGGNNAGGNNGGFSGGNNNAGSPDDNSDEPTDPAEPDIGAANVSFADRTLVAGDSLTVEATLTNDGDAAGERAVEFVVNGTVVENRTVALAANETKTVTFTRQFTSPGSQTVSVDETTRTVNVEAAEPNISVAQVDQSKNSVLAGEPFELSAVVENTGTAEGATSVELELFGEVVDTKRVTVPAGETREVTFTRKIQAPGSYTASVGNATVSLQVADDNSTTTEANTSTGGSSDVLSPGFGPTVAVLALALAVAGRFVWRRKE